MKYCSVFVYVTIVIFRCSFKSVYFCRPYGFVLRASGRLALGVGA